MKSLRKSHWIGWLLACALGAGGSALAAAPPMTKDAYKAAGEQIERQAKAQRKACDRLQGQAKDVCQAEAKGREKVAKAQLEAQYEPSPEAEKLAKFTQAEAEYDVARVRCGAARGKAKDTCVARAKHDREAAIRLAKVEKVEEVNELKTRAEERKHLGQKAQKPPPKS